jgi:bifunctional aspartokinase / homoserine dehydrogenase 1
MDPLNRSFETSLSQPESVSGNASARISESLSGHSLQYRPGRNHSHKKSPRLLRVMKFGGTSVGDASCIRRVVEIVRAASRSCDVVVVVSAMAGVTNKLIAAAEYAQAGNRSMASEVFEQLRRQHETAVIQLALSSQYMGWLASKIKHLLREGEELSQDMVLRRELTPSASDSISSLGERLSAPLVAAALADQGVASEVIESTELVVTDSSHGAAEPYMEWTRTRCQARLRPLLHQGIVPVVTGFLGATLQGVLTTLGRGGSDYSATIVGSAMDASEVVIWTDVDGVMTADPRLVSGACTIPEISYREATDLAYFGAKVLHPKTLFPLMRSETPVWIRNTFAPERPGTKITPHGHQNGRGIKALTSNNDFVLIRVGGPAITGGPQVLDRILRTAASVAPDVLLMSHSASPGDVRCVVLYKFAERVAEALKWAFARELACGNANYIISDQAVALLTMIGEKLHVMPEITGRLLSALSRENVGVLGVSQGSSASTISLVIACKDTNAAIAIAHQEFQLGASF